MKVIFCFLITATSRLAFAQLFQPCPTRESHCLCQNGIIDCAGHGLPTVPRFQVNRGSWRELRLSDNNINTISANAFSTLKVTTILLDNNNISSIDPSAFSGVSSHLKTLNIAHNRLVKLPYALQSIALDDLDLSWNPIPGYQGRPHRPGTDGFTDGVMRYLGSTLTKFAFGDSSLTSWPKSLTHLNQLRELRLSGANITYLPSNAFHGFEQTLRKLTIEYAALAAVPLAISSLRNLEELHLDHLDVPGRDGMTVMFGDVSMTAAPFTPIADTLRVLSLEYDGLTTFPEVISDLKVLEDISLSGNTLDFVSDEAIQLLKNSKVSKLQLKNCGLKRIPGSISDLRNLKELDFSQNEIRSIESTDLQDLNSLQKLVLSENPLRYFSDNSLCGLNNLTTLDLYNSSLTELSKSLKNLGKLDTLDLRESKIDCTCDITWFKKWLDQRPRCGGRRGEHTQNITIQGRCETIDQNIMSYIDDRLPECPDFARITNVSCTGECTSKR